MPSRLFPAAVRDCLSDQPTTVIAFLLWQSQGQVVDVFLLNHLPPAVVIGNLLEEELLTVLCYVVDWNLVGSFLLGLPAISSF